ncbi:serine/threonine protein kinase [Candidatus Sumerlaeota bacterium]|nr:serine/threonine protein kinase [Candidatus Sumerlaeota bacterium]
MPTTAKCPRCLTPLEFPVLIEGEHGNAWVRCHTCALHVIFDQTGTDTASALSAVLLARQATFPGYRLLGVLAIGGMGFLYSAVREKDHLLCALKAVPPEFSGYRSLLQRFRREAYAMRALRHPGFLPLLEEAQDRTPPFFTMPFVAGRTLKQVIDERDLMTLDETTAVIAQLGESLHTLHQSGFVHRDVKPSNVLLGSRGEVLLFDFGVVQESTGQSDLTDEGMALGTPTYNAPETFERCETSPLSDQYSLAVIIYQMLTTKLPMGVFPIPSSIARDLPRDSETALLRALAHDPAERHDSVKQFVRSFMRPMMYQSAINDTQREIIQRLAQPTPLMLAVEPGYEAFPENAHHDIGLNWLVKKLLGK